MSNYFDVIVIGAGPAGYVAAIRCAQLGLKTACVDDWINETGEPALGGTCLNAGCIPSKALLENSEHYASLRDPAAHPGLLLGKVELDLAAVQAAKDRVVADLTGGIATLFKANDVAWFKGHGQLLPERAVKVTPHTGKRARTLGAEHVILATGSRPVDIPAARMDGRHIVDSQGALTFSEVPRRLGIIGAGVIGLEMGSVWSRYGSEVTLLEAQEMFLPPVDRDIAALALKEFGRQGLDIRLGTRVMESTVKKGGVQVSIRQGETDTRLDFDRLVVAVGRRPYTEQLAADETELLLDEGGFIHVDENWETSVPGVYAIGDVIRGPMLAHKGSAEGVAVAELIAGHPGQVNYATIPGVIYTSPEIAWTGQHEEALKQAGVRYRVGRFPFAASGRARAMHRTTGTVKILADDQSDEILGVHIIGEHASELIAEAVLAMEYRATCEDLALTVHAHPTLSEAVHEAALAASGEAIHIANRRR